MKAKRICAALLCAALLLASTACHGSRAGEDDLGGAGSLPAFELPSEFDENEQYEISFWAKSDSNKTQTAIYKAAIERFESLYPNIHVNLKLYTDYGRIYQDVITNIATDTTPNVCISYPDHIATYLTGKNVVVPLETLTDDPKYGLGGSELKFDSPKKSELVSKFLEECVIGGELYALPFMRSSEACYVNKTYVEALGYELPEVLTWDFVFEVCSAAMEKNEDGTYKLNGQNVMIPFIYKSTDNMMIQMLKQLGADYSNDEGDILIFNDETKGILTELAGYAEERSFSTFKISSYPGNFLNRGQCIFAVDSTAGATWMGTNAPNIDVPEEELAEFETVVMAVPQYDVENPQMISQGPSLCVFNKSDSGEVLASWIFAQFLLTDEVQIAYSQTEGYVPVTTKAQETEEYLSYINATDDEDPLYYGVKLAATRLVIDNVENTFVTPVFNGSASLRNAAGQMIEEVCKSARRGETVDEEYVDVLFRKMTSLYYLDVELSEISPLAICLVVAIAVTDSALIAYLVLSHRKRKKLLNKAAAGEKVQ